MTILWPSKHGSGSRHAVDPGPHPDCDEECEGNQFLDPEKVRNNDAVRRATVRELEEFLPTPVSKRVQIVPSGTHPYRILKMLYVTDPVQAESNRRRAAEDLGFMHATISQDEWALVEHLTAYVHGPNQVPLTQKNVKVLIHEWVGLLNMSMNFANR